MMQKLLKALEWFLRHAIVYPVLRLVLHNPSVEGPLDLSRIQRLLILRYDRIGDMIVTTPFFRILKKMHPTLTIGVLCSPTNAEIISCNPYVDHIHILHRNWWRTLKTVREARGVGYDVVVNLIFNRTTSGGLLANLIAPGAIKVGQGSEKYRFYFNKLLSLPRGTLHMTEILNVVFQEIFGIVNDPNELKYEIPVKESARERVRVFVQEFCTMSSASEGNRSFVVMNISAKENYRRLSIPQCEVLLRTLAYELRLPVALIASPEDTELRDRLLRRLDTVSVAAFPRQGKSTLLEVAELVRHASLVVTPDTSIVHFAAAAEKPVIGFYSGEHQDEWLPYRIPHKILRAQPGRWVRDIPTDQLREFLLSSCNELLSETNV